MQIQGDKGGGGRDCIWHKPFCIGCHPSYLWHAAHPAPVPPGETPSHCPILPTSKDLLRSSPSCHLWSLGCTSAGGPEVDRIQKWIAICNAARSILPLEHQLDWWQCHIVRSLISLYSVGLTSGLTHLGFHCKWFALIRGVLKLFFSVSMWGSIWVFCFRHHMF